MSPFTGLDIQIISSGRALTLYADPDEEQDHNSKPMTRQRYVQATTGAEFQVKVSLNKHFKWHTLKQEDAVRVIVKYDNQNQTWYHDFARYAFYSARHKYHPVQYSFSTINRFDKASQQWIGGNLSFGALEASKLIVR